MDNKQEYLLCSAIKRKEPKSSVGYPDNQLCYIELGRRHFEIFQKYGEELEKGPQAQGFYTSLGRFVDRKEARIIAEKCGQISGKIIGGVLTSEDLY